MNILSILSKQHFLPILRYSLIPNRPWIIDRWLSFLLLLLFILDYYFPINGWIVSLSSIHTFNNLLHLYHLTCTFLFSGMYFLIICFLCYSIFSSLSLTNFFIFFLSFATYSVGFTPASYYFSAASASASAFFVYICQ